MPFETPEKQKAMIEKEAEMRHCWYEKRCRQGGGASGGRFLLLLGFGPGFGSEVGECLGLAEERREAPAAKPRDPTWENNSNDGAAAEKWMLADTGTMQFTLDA